MTTETGFADGPQFRHGWTAGDNGWDTGMESNLTKLNMLVMPGVIARQDAAPGSPSDGDMYVVGTSGSGAFSTHSNALAAFYGSTWHFLAPWIGLRLWNADTAEFEYWDGSAWSPEPGGGSLADAPNDGTAYVRQSGAWVAESGGTVTESLVLAIGDETTAITTGSGLVTFRMPYAFTLTSIRASLTASSSSGAVEVDVKAGGSTVFTTDLTIDASEKTSTTAATAAVLGTTALTDDQEITVDIVAAGTTAAGLKVTLIGHQ